MAPAGLSLFFLGIRALEGRPQLGPGDVATKLGPTLVLNYALWVPVQLVGGGMGLVDGATG